MKLHTRQATIFTAAATLLACVGLSFAAGCARTRVDGGSLNLKRDVTNEPTRDRNYNRTRIRVTLPGTRVVPLPATERHRFDDPESTVAPGKPVSSAVDAPFGDEIVTMCVFGEKDEPTPEESVVTVNGNTIKVPHGATIDVDVETDNDKVGSSGRTLQTADSKGSTFSIPGEADVKGLNAGAASVSLGGVDSKGNETHGSASTSAASLEKVTGVKGLNFFHVIGGLAILGAGVFFWISKNWKAALLIAGVGVLSICVGTIVNEITVWHAFGVIVAGMAAVLAFAWIERKDSEDKIGIDRIVRAVSQSGAAGKVVTDKIKAQTDDEGTRDAVSRAVKRSKRRMRIVDEKKTTTTPSSMDAGGASANGAASGVGDTQAR